MFSIPMAIVDFIPVVLFLAAVIVLQKELYFQMLKWQFAIFVTGGNMCFVAGLFKAIYKLLYAAEICDFQRLNMIFFPLQTTGYLLIGFASIAFVANKKKKSGDALYGVALAPPVFDGTLIFVVGMILGVSLLCGAFAVISVKMKKIGAMIIFILSLIFCLGMGYLSTRNFDNASMNWVAQFTNIVGQGLFLVGALMLKKAGLSKYKESISK